MRYMPFMQILEAKQELIHDVFRFPFVQPKFRIFVMNNVGEQVASGAKFQEDVPELRSAMLKTPEGRNIGKLIGRT